MNSFVVSEMDESRYFISITRPDGKALRGTFSRQSCYESYIWTNDAAGTYHSEFGYAMAMVNSEMDEVLFQFQTKIDFAAGKGREFSAVELMGQASSPNLKLTQPNTGHWRARVHVLQLSDEGP